MAVKLTKKTQESEAETLRPTESRLNATGAAAAKTPVLVGNPDDLLFGKNNYRLMLVGLALVVLGFVLMSGGSMPDANTWDENLIYSFTRITLAPIVILTGLGIEIYAIFANKSSEKEMKSI